LKIFRNIELLKLNPTVELKTTDSTVILIDNFIKSGMEETKKYINPENIISLRIAYLLFSVYTNLADPFNPQEIQISSSSLATPSNDLLEEKEKLLNIFEDELSTLKFHPSPKYENLKSLLIPSTVSSASKPEHVQTTVDNPGLLPLPFEYRDIVRYSKNARFVCGVDFILS
jgi:hypothetical protein